MKKYVYALVVLAAMIITATNPALNILTKIIVAAACIFTIFVLLTENRYSDGKEK